MQDSNYPSIYVAANELSKSAQSEYFYTIGLNLLSLAGAVCISVFYQPNPILIGLQVFFLLLSLGCTISVYLRAREKVWYGARALAESIKTSTWKYAIKTEPFEMKDEVATQLFVKTLSELIKGNKEIAKKNVSSSNDKEITDWMIETRKSESKKRKEIYLKDRIDDQLNWYIDKCRANGRKLKQLLFLMAFSTLLAIASAILRFSFLDASTWPTDIYISIATSLLAWTQARRYGELQASYSQAATEIKLIKTLFSTVRSQQDLALFVQNAENAFSREHTQWIARRAAH